jgi:hypothetical protein
MKNFGGLFRLGSRPPDELVATEPAAKQGKPYWVRPGNEALFEALTVVCKRNNITPSFKTDETTLWTLAALALALTVKHKEAEKSETKRGRPRGTYKYDADEEAIRAIWDRRLANPRRKISEIIRDVVREFETEGRWGDNELSGRDPHEKRLKRRLQQRRTTSVLAALLAGVPDKK